MAHHVHQAPRNERPNQEHRRATGGVSSGAPSSVLRNVQTIAELEARKHANRSAVDRFSDRVSAFAGSAWFLLFHVVWFTGWLVINRLAATPFDPYPYTFLTFLVSLEAIFLTSFVLISQNHLEAQAYNRAALDLQINLLAEGEMTQLLRTVTGIADHLGLKELTEATDSRELASHTDIAALAAAVEAAATRATSE
jgi:uncharacterized membrane protein